MARFRGRYDFSIDQKGRINIPSKFRKLLSPAAEETFVICRAPEGCLWAYPKDEWEKFEDELNSKPVSREFHKFQRVLQSSLSDCPLDSQGRILLTPLQMKIAGINKNVTIIGSGSHLEVWDTGRFEEYEGSGEGFDEAYYKIFGSGNRPD
jgi:MraZ protein